MPIISSASEVAAFLGIMWDFHLGMKVYAEFR
jgi:hypothetical protein